MALDPRAAMLKINQERMDVQKGLAASQADIGRKMTKKGTKGAIGSWLGQLAAPVLFDWGTTALLNTVLPGMGIATKGLGSLYKAAKGVPLLKAGAKGLLTAYGGAKGGEMGAGSVSIGESEDLMKKYMAGTVSGEKGMRFDRGATEAMESQKDLQLEALSDLMKVDAGKAGLKAAGSSLLGSLKTASEARRTGDAAGGISERLKSIRETQGELTAQDYMSAFTESGKQAKKDLLSTQSLKDWSAKREGLTFGQAMKYSDEALTSPALPTVPKVDMKYMNEQLESLSQPTRIAGAGSASGQFGDFVQGDSLDDLKNRTWHSETGSGRRKTITSGILPPSERAMGDVPSSYVPADHLLSPGGGYESPEVNMYSDIEARMEAGPSIPKVEAFTNPQSLRDLNIQADKMEAAMSPSLRQGLSGGDWRQAIKSPPLGYNQMLEDLDKTNALQQAWRNQIQNKDELHLKGLYRTVGRSIGADKYSSLMNNNWYTKGYGEL